MDQNQDCVRSDESKTLTFILDSYSKVKYKRSSRAALRESFMTRLSMLETVQLSKNDLRYFCQYCSLPWNECNYTVKILPEKKPGKRILKLVRKQEEAPEKLSKFEKGLLEYVKTSHGNKLVLRCLACKKKTVKYMNKNLDSHKPLEASKETVTIDKKKKRKKKKKKDVFVGLNSEVVLKTVEEMKRKQVVDEPLTIRKEPHKTNLSLVKRDRNDECNIKKTCEKQNVPLKTKSKTSVASGKHTNVHKSYFHKLEEKKEVEIQNKINMAKKTERMKKMLTKKMCNKKSNKFSDFKNFLRDLGNPSNS